MYRGPGCPHLVTPGGRPYTGTGHSGRGSWLVQALKLYTENGAMLQGSNDLTVEFFTL